MLIVEEKRALQSQAKSDKSSAPQPAPPTPPSILSQRTIFLLDFFLYLPLAEQQPPLPGVTSDPHGLENVQVALQYEVI